MDVHGSTLVVPLPISPPEEGALFKAPMHLEVK